MRSRRTSSRANRPHADRIAGFTLIEIIVVVGMFTMLAGLSLMIGLDSYRKYAFHDVEDTIVMALARARSESMTGICGGSSCAGGRKHGVKIGDGVLTVFEGDSYDTRDSSVDEIYVAATAKVTIAPSSPTEIVFERLSGIVLATGDIGISDEVGNTSVIRINSEGRIDWGN
jgi:Tfp pilus assembly protein FimT